VKMAAFVFEAGQGCARCKRAPVVRRCSRRRAQTARRRLATEGDAGGGEKPAEGQPQEQSQGQPQDVAQNAENPLFELLNKFKPEDLVSRFEETSSSEISSAFQTTLKRLLGSMPSSKYGLQVKTIVGNLVSLMQTCTMTGYLMRNAQYRLNLTRDYAPKLKELPHSQLDLKGGTAVVTFPSGKVKEVSAEEYVAQLRTEAQALREELERLKKGGPNAGNELYEIFTSLEPENLRSLTDEAGPEVTNAISLLIQKVLGVKNGSPNPLIPIETSREDLGKLLFYSMVSGYFLREAELRMYVQDRLQLGGELRIPALMDTKEKARVEELNSSDEEQQTTSAESADARANSDELHENNASGGQG